MTHLALGYSETGNIKTDNIENVISWTGGYEAMGKDCFYICQYIKETVTLQISERCL